MEKSILSKTIDILRFPIMLGVVAEHAFFQTPSGDGYPVYSTVKFFLSDVSTEVLPPPLFFLVSGMLFFWGLEKLSSSIYFQKIRKRFRTVLIPYLFWNLLILGVLYVGQTFFADLAGQEATRVSDYSIKDWLWAFWDTSKGTAYASATVGDPVYFPFWFIRDAMVLFLLSPIIMFLLKKTGGWILIPLGAWWLAAGFPDIPRWVYGVAGFSPRAIFFFCLGAWTVISKKDFAENILGNKNAVFILLPVVAAGIVIAWLLKGNTLYQPFIRIYTLAAVLLCFCVAARFSSKGSRVWAFLSGATFFLYASHGYLVKILPHVVIKKTGLSSDWGLVLLYFSCLIVSLAICLSVYWILKKTAPRILGAITGGRC